MRLNRILLSADAASAGFDFFFAVLMQVLRIRLMVTVCPAVEQLLTGFLFPVTAVDIYRVVKLLKTPVVSPFLLEKNRRRAVLRMDLSALVVCLYCLQLQPPWLPPFLYAKRRVLTFMFISYLMLCLQLQKVGLTPFCTRPVVASRTGSQHTERWNCPMHTVTHKANVIQLFEHTPHCPHPRTRLTAYRRVRSL